MGCFGCLLKVDRPHYLCPISQSDTLDGTFAAKVGGLFFLEASYAGKYEWATETGNEPGALLVQFTEDLRNIQLGTGFVQIA